jgi:hypothetical protein
MRARFFPQAWINDYAVNVDPAGPSVWQVTPEFLVELLGTFRVPERCFVANELESDYLRNDPAAPEWIRKWQGPFEVEPVEDRPGEFDQLLAAARKAS